MPQNEKSDMLDFILTLIRKNLKLNARKYGPKAVKKKNVETGFVELMTNSWKKKLSQLGLL